jgi:hypothetical protein
VRADRSGVRVDHFRQWVDHGATRSAFAVRPCKVLRLAGPGWNREHAELCKVADCVVRWSTLVQARSTLWSTLFPYGGPPGPPFSLTQSHKRELQEGCSRTSDISHKGGNRSEGGPGGPARLRGSSRARAHARVTPPHPDLPPPSRTRAHASTRHRRFGTQYAQAREKLTHREPVEFRRLRMKERLVGRPPQQRTLTPVMAGAKPRRSLFRDQYMRITRA